MSNAWFNIHVEVDYEGGEGWSVRATSTQRGDPTRVSRSPWYVGLFGDELLEIVAVMVEQAWEGKSLDGTVELREPGLPFDQG